ncbi:Ldh family oxidoreductase [Patescibacteria group bacterium]|nr:Ldh family oxidoreductase [Patescibacteria group bacterium]
MKVTISKAETLLKNAASEFVTKKETLYFAKETIFTHLKKYPRMHPFKEAVHDVENWSLNKESQVKTLVDKGSSLLINFSKLAPSLKIKWVHDELEKRARKYGISMMGMYNTGGIHALNFWTEGLADRNLIGISMYQGGYDGVVPFGGTKGMFGTAPLSYAVPSKTEPILADLATSNISYFELLKTHREGKSLPPNSAVDVDGVPTNDPDKTLFDDESSNLLPIGGGHKGFAILLLVEMLSGALVRGCLSNEFTQNADLPDEQGFVVFAIDISTFTDIDKFKNSVSSLCEEIRSQKPGKGFDTVMVPGDASYRRMENLGKVGKFDIEKELLDKIERVSR